MNCKTTALFLFFFCLIVSYPAIAEVEDSEVLRVRLQVIDFENQFDATTTEDAKRAILAEMEQYIRKSNANKEDTAQYLMWTGHCFYNMGDFHKSSILFKEVRDMPGIGDFWRIDALRVLAQTELFINNDHTKSSELYQTMVNKIYDTSDSRVQNTIQPYLDDAYSKGAYSFDQLGKYENAIALRDSALNDKRLSLNTEGQSWYNLENARSYNKAGMNKKSIELYDYIFKEYPSFGISNGDIVSYRLEQVAAYGYKPGDPRRLNLLQDIWKNNDYAEFPQILAMGAGLAERYSEAGDLLKSLNINEELLKRLESQRVSATDTVKNIYAIEAQYVTCIIQLSQRYSKMGATMKATELIELFLREFPDHEFAENARHWLKHLEHNDPLGMLDLTQESYLMELPSLDRTTPNDGTTSSPTKDISAKLSTGQIEHKCEDPKCEANKEDGEDIQPETVSNDDKIEVNITSSYYWVAGGVFALAGAFFIVKRRPA